MFDIVCYLTAVILLALAALLHGNTPARIACTGVAAFVLPFLVHAVQAR